MNKKIFMLFYPIITISSVLTVLAAYFTGFLQAKAPELVKQKGESVSFVAVPKVLGINSSQVISEDGTDELICQYLIKYNSPMAGTCVEFSDIFRQNNIDPVFALAIAQCESNLGLKMPVPVSQNCYEHIQSGEEPEQCCHNPFGWGVHSEGTLCFNTWEEGYQTVGRGLRQKYVDEGLYTTQEIMSKYNHISAEEKDGSWARCVNQYIEEIETLKVRKY